MMKLFLRLTIWSLLFVGISSCQNNKVPLDEEQFSTLLLEMHRVDGILAINRENSRSDDLKNYAYYNELFRKYDITRTDFDSCMYHYSTQIEMFSKMYDVIIDSLSKELTAVDKILNKLKANDTINYFQLIDTIRLDTTYMMDNIIRLDTIYTANNTIHLDTTYMVSIDTIGLDSVFSITIDNLLPGLYKFSTKFQFDSLSKKRYRRIASFFTSTDRKDTLRVRNLVVAADTLVRTYNWSQYIDSVYTQLEIRYMEEVPLEDRPKIYKNRKWIKPSKKEKAIKLKEFGGRAWDNELLRPYITRKTEKRLKEGLERQR